MLETLTSVPHFRKKGNNPFVKVFPSLEDSDADLSDFTIAFSPELSKRQIETALNALADYYRACGGAGFRIDFELTSVLVATPEYVGR